LKNGHLEDEEGDGRRTLRRFLAKWALRKGSGSGSCSVMGFGDSSVEPSGSADRVSLAQNSKPLG